MVEVRTQPRPRYHFEALAKFTFVLFYAPIASLKRSFTDRGVVWYETMPHKALNGLSLFFRIDVGTDVRLRVLRDDSGAVLLFYFDVHN